MHEISDQERAQRLASVLKIFELEEVPDYFRLTVTAVAHGFNPGGVSLGPLSHLPHMQRLIGAIQCFVVTGELTLDGFGRELAKVQQEGMRWRDRLDPPGNGLRRG